MPREFNVNSRNNKQRTVKTNHLPSPSCRVCFFFDLSPSNAFGRTLNFVVCSMQHRMFSTKSHKFLHRIVSCFRPMPSHSLFTFHNCSWKILEFMWMFFVRTCVGTQVFGNLFDKFDQFVLEPTLKGCSNCDYHCRSIDAINSDIVEIRIL